MKPDTFFLIVLVVMPGLYLILRHFFLQWEKQVFQVISGLNIVSTFILYRTNKRVLEDILDEESISVGLPILFGPLLALLLILFCEKKLKKSPPQWLYGILVALNISVSALMVLFHNIPPT